MKTRWFLHLVPLFLSEATTVPQPHCVSALNFQHLHLDKKKKKVPRAYYALVHCRADPELARRHMTINFRMRGDTQKKNQAA